MAFRLNAHGLVERRAEDGLLEAAGRCGVQNSPPGSALLALHARVQSVTPELVDQAIAEDKSLLQTWLGDPLHDNDPEQARAELVRRDLRCYGPITRKDFAAWLGVFVGDADQWWSLVQDELTEVEFGVQAWILAEGREALRSSPMPKGVRLLPPRDPYTQLRDHETIVDEKHHGAVWMPSGDPGTVMINGKITGTWRPRKSGRKLTLIIETFDSLRAGDKKSIKEEAEQVALSRGASSATVDFDHSSAGDR
jgi:hypothetical protein